MTPKKYIRKKWHLITGNLIGVLAFLWLGEYLGALGFGVLLLSHRVGYLQDVRDYHFEEAKKMYDEQVKIIDPYRKILLTIGLQRAIDEEDFEAAARMRNLAESNGWAIVPKDNY